MDIFKLLKNVIDSPISTARGISVFAGMFSIVIAPEFIVQIISGVASFWGAIEMISKDK